MIRITICKACKKPIAFRPNVSTGKVSPITEYEVPNGNIEILKDGSYRIVSQSEREDKPGPRRINHFVDCPAAKSFQGSRKS